MFDQFHETFEEENVEFECIECGDVYCNSNSCPTCGSTLAKLNSEEDELTELSF